VARVLVVVAVLAAVAVIGVIVWPSGDDNTISAVPASVPWQPEPGRPFTEPKQLERPEGHGPQVIEVDLSARTGQTEVAGSPVWARTYNGGFVGPTIHARPGDTIKVTFENTLGGGRPTNIHYHGMHVSPNGNADNIFAEIDDGERYESVVKLEDKQPRGTFWYHAHFHGISDGQVMGGLSGLLIVDGLKNLLPDKFKGVNERQLTLKDVQLGTDENRPEGIDGDYIAENPDINPAPESTFRMVNGLYKPQFKMQSSTYELWRLANIGSDVFYNVAFVKTGSADKGESTDPTQQPFAIVAEDGIPVWEVTRPTRLLIPPGKRFDVLVMAESSGTYELQSVPYAQRANNKLVPKPIPCNKDEPNCPEVTDTLATVDVTAARRSVPTLPTRLARKGGAAKRQGGRPRVEDLSQAHVDAEKTFEFSYNTTDPDKFVAEINGQPFTHGEKPVVWPALGDVQEWTLVNKTRDDHPFHIHINGFQVMSVSGDPDFKAHGHQDVVNIPKQRKDGEETVDGKVVIRHRFETFSGWFVFHCHILNHEDAGMMSTIQVLERTGDPVTPPPESEHHPGQ
jgi:suppressor of ftsI